MGWSQKRKPNGMSVVEFIRDRTTLLKWTPGPLTYTVLAMQMVHNDTVYAAVEKRSATGRDVFAVVFEIAEHPGEHLNLEIKDQDEEQFPHRAACPQHILELLTPTSDYNSNAWRAACRATIRTANGYAQGTRLDVMGHEIEVVQCHGAKGADVIEIASGRRGRLTALQMTLATAMPLAPVRQPVIQPVMEPVVSVAPQADMQPVAYAYVEEDDEECEGESMAM